MTNSLRRVLVVAITSLLIAMPSPSRAQEVGEQRLREALTVEDVVEETATSVPVSNPASLRQRQPITKDELARAYGPEGLAIMNEQLRREIDLLAREYRESERRNEIKLFGLGAVIALIFLGIGFLIGKRFGGRRLL